MKYIKDPKIIAILVLIVCIVLEGVFAQKKITEINTRSETEIHKMDSTYRADSLVFSMKYKSLDSAYSVSLHVVDSLNETITTNMKTSKTTIRYVYVDSTIEVIVEDTEYIQISERTIKTLRDSVGSSEKKITELNTEITDLKKELEIAKADTHTTTETHVKVIEYIDKKFAVYGNVFGRSDQSLDLGIGAEVGADYKILAPLYIGAAIRKDGIDKTEGYNAVAKVGVKFEF
jgi:hypothetical protein